MILLYLSMSLRPVEDDMKIGDYVAKITNAWQKHNKWMEFPDELPEPLGIIVGSTRGSYGWSILKSDGSIVVLGEKHIKVIHETR
jgi:hypothetical protein